MPCGCNCALSVLATCSPSVARPVTAGMRHARQFLRRLHGEYAFVFGEGLDVGHRRRCTRDDPAHRAAHVGEAVDGVALLLLHRVGGERLQQRGTGLARIENRLARCRRLDRGLGDGVQIVVGVHETRVIAGFLGRILVVGEHPRHAGQIARRVRRVGHEVVAHPDVRFPVVVWAQRRDHILDERISTARLRIGERCRHHAHRLGVLVAVIRRLRPCPGLQDVLRLVEVAILEQRNTVARQFPHRAQHAQHLADRGLDLRIARIGKALADERQHAVGLFIHAQGRQRAGRPHVRHGVTAQRVQP